MAGARFGALVLAAAVLVAVQAGPVPSTSQRIQETKELSKVAQVQLDQAEQRLQQARDALIKQLIVDVAHDQGIRGAVQAVRVEQRLEDEILTAARAARGHPQELQKLDQYVRRDKRALGLITSLLGGAGPVNRGPTYSAYIGGGASAFGPAKPSGGGFLTGILGSSSGLLGSSSGGGEGSTSPEDELTNGTPPGSDSGSILSLITPILGSLSGSSGGGGGGDSDGEGGGSSGSDSGSILSLVTPLLGSSSGNGYNDVPNSGDDNDGSSGASASASAGSDSGSILSLVTPLLGSSSGGGGGGGGGDEGGDGGASAGGGSDSSAILGLVTPLLGSSSGGSGGSGGGGGDGGSSSGGGGSDLSSILGISNSGGGGGGSVSIGGGGGGNHLTEKLKILTDGVSLLLRVKFLIFRKLFGLIGGASG